MGFAEQEADLRRAFRHEEEPAAGYHSGGVVAGGPTVLFGERVGRAIAADLKKRPLHVDLPGFKTRRETVAPKEKIDRYAHLTGIFVGHDVHLDHDGRVDGYMPLELVLCAAYAQAAAGKGKERHAAGDDFNDQPILTIGRLLKSADGEAYQAIKKLREGLMMHRRGNSEAALREMLGAINYIAATALLVAEEADLRDRAKFAKVQQEQSDGAFCCDKDPL